MSVADAALKSVVQPEAGNPRNGASMRLSATMAADLKAGRSVGDEPRDHLIGTVDGRATQRECGLLRQSPRSRQDAGDIVLHRVTVTVEIEPDASIERELIRRRLVREAS